MFSLIMDKNDAFQKKHQHCEEFSEKHRGGSMKGPICLEVRTMAKGCIVTNSIHHHALIMHHYHLCTH